MFLTKLKISKTSRIITENVARITPKEKTKRQVLIMKNSKKYFNDKTVTAILYSLAVVVVISVIIVTVSAFASQRSRENVITTTTTVRTDPTHTTTKKGTTVCRSFFSGCKCA